MAELPRNQPPQFHALTVAVTACRVMPAPVAVIDGVVECHVLTSVILARMCGRRRGATGTGSGSRFRGAASAIRKKKSSAEPRYVRCGSKAIRKRRTIIAV